MPHTAPSIPTETIDYRRQARKIRANFARQPLLRHYALSDLARQCDAARESQVSPLRARAVRTAVRRVAPVARYLPTEPGTATSAVERGFADHAADRLRVGVFTFSDRARLLQGAEKLGIPRFRANLILALEQHRVGPVQMNVPPESPTSKSWIPQLLMIVIVEAAIVGMFVWTCGL